MKRLRLIWLGAVCLSAFFTLTTIAIMSRLHRLPYLRSSHLLRDGYSVRTDDGLPDARTSEIDHRERNDTYHDKGALRLPILARLWANIRGRFSTTLLHGKITQTTVRLNVDTASVTSGGRRDRVESVNYAPKCETVNTSSAADARATPFKIYVYDLPTRFNLDLARCVEKKLGYCFDFAECGMGRLLDDKRPDTSLRDSHQFSLEIIMHHKMLYSPYRTMDPRQADVFYVPFYAAMACFCHPDAGPDIAAVVDDLFRQLDQYAPYRARKPHLATLGKIEREMCGDNCPFASDMRTKGMLFIGIEQEVNVSLRRYFHTLGTSIIVAPYPSYVHFRPEHGDRFTVQNIQSAIAKTNHTANQIVDEIADNLLNNRSAVYRYEDASLTVPERRNVFMLLAASGRHSHETRGILFRQTNKTIADYHAFLKQNNATIGVYANQLNAVWLATPECAKYHKYITIEWMRHARFCLQPPGDSPTRKSIYDALLSGCVPVFFREKPSPRRLPVRLPFQNYIDYDDISITLGYDLYRKLRVYDVLRLIPMREVRRLLANVDRVKSMFQYAHPYSTGAHADAVHWLLKDVAEHFKLKSL